MEFEKNINDLPYEILVEIFSYLKVEDLVLHVRKVCKRWEEVAEDNRLWKHVTFRPSNRYSEKHIVDILKQAPKLQKIIPPYPYKEKQFLPTLIAYCKDLREIRISIDDEGDMLEKLLSECQNIECLSVYAYDFTETKSLQIISKFQKLSNLRLTGDVSKQNYNIFADISQGCPSLERMDIQHLTNYSNESLEYFLRQKKDNIHCLYLECCRPQQLCSLPLVFELCPKLQYLHIKGHVGAPNSEELVSLKKMQNLRALSMDHFMYYRMNHVADYLRTQFAHYLVELSLGKFTGLEEDLCNFIFMNCCNLRNLNIGYSPKLTDSCFKCLGNLKNLRKLHLEFCICLTDVGISYIVKSRQITYLNLNGCRNITNSSFVMCLENLKMLEELYIDGCKIKPETILQIPEKLKNLRKLQLRMIDVLLPVIKTMRQIMPYLYIF